MTRKSKRQHGNDEELKAALRDPNAIVHYNPDGSYDIEYREPTPEPVVVRDEYKDYFDQLYNVYYYMSDYCQQQGLSLLDDGPRFVDFCDLVHYFVPETRPEDYIPPPAEKSDEQGWTVVKKKK